MRLGVAGTGRMAATMVDAAGTLPGVEVAAVFSGSLGRAQEFVSRHAPQASAHDKLDTFLSHVDAVYIATSPDRHLAVIEACAAAGRPVLCEKPLTPTLAETEQALSLASEAGIPLVEAVWTLVLPAYRALRDQVMGSGRGSARLLRFDFSYPVGPDAPAHLLDPAHGGVLLDRAVYGYAAAIDLLGPIKEQRVNVTRDGNGLDRSAELNLFHAEGGRSIVTVSFDLLGPNTMDVATDAGLACLGPPSLAAERMLWQPYVAGAVGSADKRGLLARLKTRPFLRNAKAWKDRQRGTVCNYGASPYSNILAHFADVAAKGTGSSDIVPASLSRDIAFWVADARSAAAQVGDTR